MFKGYLAKLLKGGDLDSSQGQRLVDSLLYLKKTSKLQENTGYNLLCVGPLGGKSTKMYLINPHALPAALMTTDDGMVNSRQAFDAAIYEIAASVSKFNSDMKIVKDMLVKLK